MLRLDDAPQWRARLDDVAASVGRGQRVVLRTPVAARRVAAGMQARLPGSVYLPLTAGADQVERALLDLCFQLGDSGWAAACARHLAQATDAVQPVLDDLRSALGARPLVVCDWDGLGVQGVDRELGLALRPRVDLVQGWLADHARVLVVRRGAPKGRDADPLPSDASVQLVNGAAQDTSDLVATLFEPEAIAPALTALALGCTPDELAGLPAGALRARVLDLLPPSVHALLTWLGVHDRPLDRSHLPVSDPAALKLGMELGLWSSTGTSLLVADGWADAVRAALPGDAQRNVHRELAESFLRDFRLGDPTALGAAPSVLEAHRHLVEAGDLERARQCWQFGAPLWIDAARRRSLAGRYSDAVHLYDQVVGAMDRAELPAPPRLRAYARHYLHFNCARAELESFAATEQGFRKAVREWPENALFWSRLVQVDHYMDRPAAARKDLAQAESVVPDHPQKKTVLIARTVGGLLARDRVVEAVQTWGDYQPDTPYAQEVLARLVDKLHGGFMVQRLLLDAREPLIFTRPLRLQIVRGGKAWSAEAPDLDGFAQGGAPLSALGNLVRRVRQECQGLVRAYTHLLSAEDRMRKQRMLGLIDVVASRVDAPAPREWWVMGHLERDDDGRVWLHSRSLRLAAFEVPAALVTVVDDLPHLARVDAGSDGVPVGPVRELRPGFRGSDDALWDAWRELVARGA